MPNPQQLIRAILDAAAEGKLEDAERAIEQYGKKIALSFYEYHNRFRREEGVWFKKECDKLGGMFSLADYGINNIYKDFLERKPIKCYWGEKDRPHQWEFNDNGELVHVIKDGKIKKQTP